VYIALKKKIKKKIKKKRHNSKQRKEHVVYETGSLCGAHPKKKKQIW
jgi:hypothetical protein